MAKNKEELIEETELEELETFKEDDELMTHEGEEETFPGGPTYNQLADWKSRYNGEIYMSDFDDDVFIWRPLRRKEYRDINRVEGQADEFYVEESICRLCVIWPENYSSQAMVFGKAGIPSTLSNLILERSGFVRPQTVKL